MKISTSKEANPNYLAKLIYIQEEDYFPHTNADKLKCVTVDFQNVITGLDAPAGFYVYFPVECQIADKILSYTNSYRDSTLNKDKEATGFFETNKRVRALRLRSLHSQGYILPAEKVFRAFGHKVSQSDLQGMNNDYFDYIDSDLVCNKYIIPEKTTGNPKGKNQAARLSRLVEGQVHLHVDTDNLRKEIQRIPLDSEVTVSFKNHGTSGWSSHVLAKTPQNLVQKALTWLKLIPEPVEYDLIYGSRKTIKNKYIKDPKGNNHFFCYDIWQSMVEKYELKDKLPKGFSLYYEIVGFTKDKAYIQSKYDYGCNQDLGEAKIKVYRVTFTNPDGIVFDLSTLDAKAFTEKIGLEFVDVLYHGKLRDLTTHLTGVDHSDLDDRTHKELIIKEMEEKWNGKNCYMCKNTVPEEGVVLRVEDNYRFEAYKLKCAIFLEQESKSLDAGEASE